MGGFDVLVIGAGMAGLSAARKLKRAGLAVQILEARERLGGRIMTVPSSTGEHAVDLGAEFVHGEKNQVWDYAHEFKLPIREVQDRHHRLERGELKRIESFWEKLEEVFDAIKNDGPDEDFATFLSRQPLEEATKILSRDYVEGFHAADASRIGTRALQRAEAAAQEHSGTRQFRLLGGYSELVTHLAADLDVQTRTVAKTIQWAPGKVRVTTQTPSGMRTYEASRAIITLPLGVLQEKGEGRVVFEPALHEKEECIEKLAMGHVTKVILELQPNSWMERLTGFVHVPGEVFPTWWTDDRGPLLTAWVGGPRSRRFAGESGKVVEAAVEAAGLVAGRNGPPVQSLLRNSFFHDWSADSFARGAYSYTPVGCSDLPSQLARPLKITLYFAGEATNAEGDQGTVHAAAGSGCRAADELLGTW